MEVTEEEEGEGEGKGEGGVVVKLEGGRELRGDVVVGADGERFVFVVLFIFSQNFIFFSRIIKHISTHFPPLSPFPFPLLPLPPPSLSQEYYSLTHSP